MSQYIDALKAVSVFINDPMNMGRKLPPSYTSPQLSHTWPVTTLWLTPRSARHIKHWDLPRIWSHAGVVDGRSARWRERHQKEWSYSAAEGPGDSHHISLQTERSTRIHFRLSEILPYTYLIYVCQLLAKWSPSPSALRDHHPTSERTPSYNPLLQPRMTCQWHTFPLQNITQFRGHIGR